MLTIEVDPRAADAAAVRASVDVVGQVLAADLTRPTPCAGWDLAALLAHMTEQHYVFATAAGARPSPGDDYERSAGVVLDAFAAVADLEQPFLIPEFGRPVPGRLAIGFHLVDYVVHAWDVARTIGIRYAPGPEELALALALARGVPDGPERLADNTPFAPGLPVPPGADPLTEILLRLGRDPS